MKFAKYLAIIAIAFSLFYPVGSMAGAGGGVDSSWLDKAKEWGLTEFANPFGYEEDGAPPDLRIIVARLVQITLGLLGTIFIVLIIYAGFTWMTAGGNEEKIKKAKDIIVSSAIGLLLILASLLITIYVVDATKSATNKLWEDYQWGG